MLSFKQFGSDPAGEAAEHVHIDPVAVAAIQETRRWTSAGQWETVAVIELHIGRAYEVEDHSPRSVARRIAEARDKAR